VNPFRDLPSVDRLLQALAKEYEALGHDAVRAAARSVLDEVRARLRAGETPTLDVSALAARARAALTARDEATIQPVFNLTGTIVHTNLGRAVLPESARDAVAAVATQACNLEYDLAAGKRGDRDSHIEPLLTELTGAQSATVVNNNAAAVLLVLNSLALAREVPVSRGQLIEIGDAFRIPDIMVRSGVKLIEVGTTNRTHARDYENAITCETAALMQVHTSNYVVQGFTKEVPLSEMADIAHAHGLPLICDLGSGTLVDLAAYGLPREMTVTEVLEAGADLVTFSGDKLLGGPQAGLIVGKTEYLKVIKRNPLRRALRVDKLRLAALAEILKLHRNPQGMARSLPTLRLMLRPHSELEAMAASLASALKQQLPGWIEISTEPSTAQPGSGSLPGQEITSVALTLASNPRRDAAARLLEQAMRGLSTPVIGRIRDNALHLDLRNLEDPAPLLALAPELAQTLPQSAP
jgi:L-seryl-tRNA(Ser) seleniumtransferase